MKRLALQQSYADCQSNSFRGSVPLDSSADGAFKSPAAIFCLVLHTVISLLQILSSWLQSSDCTRFCNCFGSGNRVRDHIMNQVWIHRTQPDPNLLGPLVRRRYKQPAN